MAEAFHQWVNNMPWWEKLYYQLFDPQAITCSTYPAIPGIYFVAPIIALIIIALLIARRELKAIDKDAEEIISLARNHIQLFICNSISFIASFIAAS